MLLMKVHHQLKVHRHKRLYKEPINLREFLPLQLEILFKIHGLFLLQVLNKNIQNNPDLKQWRLQVQQEEFESC